MQQFGGPQGNDLEGYDGGEGFGVTSTVEPGPAGAGRYGEGRGEGDLCGQSPRDRSVDIRSTNMCACLLRTENGTRWTISLVRHNSIICHSRCWHVPHLLRKRLKRQAYGSEESGGMTLLGGAGRSWFCEPFVSVVLSVVSLSHFWASYRVVANLFSLHPKRPPSILIGGLLFSCCCRLLKGPDCFRHYEMMLEGNVALVPDDSSLRSFMGGLPAFFFGGTPTKTTAVVAWDAFQCSVLY